LASTRYKKYKNTYVKKESVRQNVEGNEELVIVINEKTRALHYVIMHENVQLVGKKQVARDRHKTRILGKIVFIINA